MTEWADSCPHDSQISEKSKLLEPTDTVALDLLTEAGTNDSMAPSSVTQTSPAKVEAHKSQIIMANSSEQVGGEEKMDSKGKLVQSTDEEPQTVVVVVVEGSAAADTEPSADDTHVDMEHSDNVDDDNVSHNSSAQGDMCRICHCIAEDSESLISPCDCRGSMKWVHQKCLQTWVKSRDAKKCELCGFIFNMTSSVKPFRKWNKLDMTSVERRRVLCSVSFHIVAITCVIWSLYVLIDRTTQEIQTGNLNWPFWTKLVVVAIGFTGGLVFMYVQCKTYVKLFQRWKQFNRVIYINDIELVEMPKPEPNDSVVDEPKEVIPAL